MVRDEPTDDRRPATRHDLIPVQSPSADAQSAAGNLTQELAQLLAAAIAQSQPANRLMPGGMPTGSDLASLASLMNTASSRRGLAPVFKDGLSALSYAPPSRSNPPLNTPLEHADLGHDDEPMPIPSTWREPVGGDHDRGFRQQMGAAFLGLVAGLILVVPTVLWLSGTFAGSQKAKTVPALPSVSAPGEFGSGAIKVAKIAVRPIEPATFVAGPLEPRAAEPHALEPRALEPRALEPRAPEIVHPVAPMISVATSEPRSHGDDSLAEATRRIETGDVAGAREILAALEESGQGSALFALAETYDPNMLAAWGTHGIAADPDRARALYKKALQQGFDKARRRLEELN
jgi:hypothetical protein